ncbi:MAG: serine/threonine protein kinase [Planctomycetota bacterium]|nr:MAG: serine/threonine protein kinase [Planctomycetota bacterium]
MSPADSRDEHELGQLDLAQAIELFEMRGPIALEHWLRARPQADPAIARQVRTLRDAGLLAGGVEPRERVPERIGRYRVLRWLGAGATGVVRLALDEREARLVAIKVLAPSFARNARLRERFDREARAIARLEHPGIVPILEAGVDGGLPYQVLEYVEGTSLEEGLDRLRALVTAPAEVGAANIAEALRLPHWAAVPPDLVRAALDWGKAIAHALAHAHERGVLHRDIKPSNVIIDTAGRARLLDFGLARVADDARMTWSADLIGTPQYLAPEIIRAGIGRADERVDVFALGACIYEIATLTSPFDAASSTRVLEAVLAHDPPRPSRINARASDSFDLLCAGALAKDPRRRYRDAVALADDIERVRAGEPLPPREQARWRHWLANVLSGWLARVRG